MHPAQTTPPVSPIKLKSATRERAGSLFAALSHPTRLKIVELLSSGEKTVNDIAHSLEVSQSGASQHLSILTRAGVLVVEPHGASRYYRIRGPRIVRILDLIAEFCDIHALYGTADGEGDMDAPMGTASADGTEAF